MAVKNHRDARVAVDPSLLEWAEYWYPISWKGVLGGGIITAVGACATIAFLLLQWRTTTIREEQSDWRTTVIEADTAKSKAELGIAQAAIAKAGVQIAEANARALEAKLALEKFKQPRLLSEPQMLAIAEKLKPFAGTKFDAAVIPGDPEAMMLVASIAAALELAGWVWADWIAPEGQLAMTYTIPTKPKIGQFGFLGVVLQIDPVHAQTLSVPANTLGSVLIAEGVELTLDVIENASIPSREVVHVTVGKKRP
jgi:hypothetical protein